MIHYLTVQDILWINGQVTDKVNPFKYAQLEEGTFFQYGYGKSEDVLGQAGNFLQGFIRLRPFSEGNRATALVSALTFLVINGYDVTLEPEKAAEWAMDVATKQRTGAEAIKEIAVPGGRPVELKPVLRTEVRVIVARYKDAIDKVGD
ncbi:MAG: hypothetical protein IH851_03695 [Armatimonadetes bacterium]|nr:hypothetical protein [Armatimonadota bacterium]